MPSGVARGFVTRSWCPACIASLRPNINNITHPPPPPHPQRKELKWCPFQLRWGGGHVAQGGPPLLPTSPILSNAINSAFEHPSIHHQADYFLFSCSTFSVAGHCSTQPLKFAIEGRSRPSLITRLPLNFIGTSGNKVGQKASWSSGRIIP